MPPLDDELGPLSRLIEALRPWLGQMIVIGGRAHRLFRFCPGASAPPYPPLFTDDVDVAVEPDGIEPGARIASRLGDFGFHEELSGDDRPPVTYYALGGEHEGFFAEFLTPLTGSEHRRDGARDVTERVGDVVAQKLRYLEVLLIAPWSVILDREQGFDLSEPASVAIANPTTYIIQKLLIHSRRKPGTRPKDILYIHDTLELFASTLSALRTIWTDSVQPTLHRRAVRLVHETAATTFETVSDDIREACLIARGRRLSPGELQERCRQGLGELLGSRDAR